LFFLTFLKGRVGSSHSCKYLVYPRVLTVK
jgi:hypothetical protein